MKISELKKHLSIASKKELEAQIAELFKCSEFVKDYYMLKYDSEYELEILEKHKEVIKHEFFPRRGHGKARLSVAKKGISEFKKLSKDKSNIADIMLFYVEIGVDFTNSYGDINETFYVSMENMYESLLKYIVTNELVDKFSVRCQKIVKDTEGMGWGFHDQLYDLYHSFVGKDKA